ncbi:peptidoglycan-binding domain-containing protein [Roseibium sp. SCP14]|uniref:peptidoglycan-binding domain-containing protein n=1 Tax=Roseibium sp. SCP14 TaxID=3141375 RepID=UPI003336280A
MKQRVFSIAAFSIFTLLCAGAAHADVACVQSELKSAGYNPGPVDGALGKRTVSASQQMGTDYGMPLPTLDDASSAKWCTALKETNAAARIDTKEKLLSEIAGRKLTLDGNWVVINADGTLEGVFGKKTVKGTWEVKDGYWCRTLTSPASNTDCQVYRLTPKGLVITRKKGKGKSVTYQVAGS